MVNLGDSMYEIDTPALLVDLDIMERNIKTMADAFRGMSAGLRPHTKTHKTPIIAHKQIAAGAIGVTCAKLGEAEVMAEAGIRNILIANQVVGEPKVTRLVNLARHSEVIVAVDDPANVRHLAEASRRKDVKLNILVEVNVGNNRCGVEPGEPAVALSRQVAEEASLSLRGLMGYEGFCQFIPRLEERRAKAEVAMEKLVVSREMLLDAGMDVEIVSGGGTGTHMITGNYPGVTEVEAGSYVFMDARYCTIECLEMFGKALTVLSTVLSTPRPGVAVCDAGLKALTNDFGTPVVKGIEGVEYLRGNEEHGHLKVEPGASIKASDKIEIFPTHCCTTTNLYDYLHCIRDGRLEAVWRITARGRSQ